MGQEELSLIHLSSGPKLIEQGEIIRAMLFSASHNTLQLTIGDKNGRKYAAVNFSRCRHLKFEAYWIAGELKIEKFGEKKIRISDGVLDVTCSVAVRMKILSIAEGIEEMAVRVSRETLDDLDKE